ncbi:MAG: hypothetical protein IT290_00315, partial [Deltaproteobacteria bacterium]|nr:hypothetical protein [Deltaproteobacteria bacterium]
MTQRLDENGEETLPIFSLLEKSLSAQSAAPRARGTFRPFIKARCQTSSIACLSASFRDSTAREPFDLLAGERIVFHFRAPADALYECRVPFATHARRNSCQIIFQLFDQASPAKPIRNGFFDAALIEDNREHSVAFEPIPDSVGKYYTLILTSPDAHPGNCVAVWGSLPTEEDPRPHGYAYRSIINTVERSLVPPLGPALVTDEIFVPLFRASARDGVVPPVEFGWESGSTESL